MLELSGLLVAVVLMLQSGAPSSPCKYEENCRCAVPGITLRWKAAYCMYLNETDDLENAGVERCLARADSRSIAKLGPCDQNAHWKKMLCGAMHKTSQTQRRRCEQDKEFMPRFVEKGPGSGS